MPRIFFSSVPTDSGSQSASYAVGAADCYPGVQQQVHLAEHSPASTTEVKNEWRYTSVLPNTFTACNDSCLYVNLKKLATAQAIQRQGR